MISEINAQIAKLSAERDAIEQQEYAKAIAGLVSSAPGKHFVYRNNCYSCPESAKDYWDVFREVVAIVQSDSIAEVCYRECYIDSRGDATMKTGKDPIYSRRLPEFFPEGWKACSRAEFDENWEHVQKTICGDRKDSK